jgi:hypothetical protein
MSSFIMVNIEKKQSASYCKKGHTSCVQLCILLEDISTYRGYSMLFDEYEMFCTSETGFLTFSRSVKITECQDIDFILRFHS